MRILPFHTDKYTYVDILLNLPYGLLHSIKMAIFAYAYHLIDK